MDIYIVAFVIVSLWVIVEFGTSGLRLFSLSKHASKESRPLIRGIAWLFMTVSGFNFFWLSLISLGRVISLSEYPIATPVAASIIVALGITSIIGRRHWWNQIIKPAIEDKDGKR